MEKTEKYTQFALVREMLETPVIIQASEGLWPSTPITAGTEDKSTIEREFSKVGRAIKKKRKLFLTGEGSSRLFPAKSLIRWGLTAGLDLCTVTEGSRQAGEYNLEDYAVFGASNSGKTREVIELFMKQKESGNASLYGLTAHTGAKLEELAEKTFLLRCGNEDAVAATKSVVEQALFYRRLIASAYGKQLDTGGLADAFASALTAEIPRDLTEAIAGAGTIYFAGRNDGVAEELTLKTNEITRKKSDYLEGTYAVHGIEEVMNPDDVVIVIVQVKEGIDKFRETLEKGVGLKVIAMAPEDTGFPTLKLPGTVGLPEFEQLAMGWNILVEVGIALGIDLDKPTRARKVGNEFTG